MKNETSLELLDCLELSLANLERDTLPRPNQIKRIREAILAAQCEVKVTMPEPQPIDKSAASEEFRKQDSREEKTALRSLMESRSRPLVKTLQQVNIPVEPLPPSRPPRPVVKTLVQVNPPGLGDPLPRLQPPNPYAEQERRRAEEQRAAQS
jgi:hypothetical protein